MDACVHVGCGRSRSPDNLLFCPDHAKTTHHPKAVLAEFRAYLKHLQAAHDRRHLRQRYAAFVNRVREGRRAAARARHHRPRGYSPPPEPRARRRRPPPTDDSGNDYGDKADDGKQNEKTRHDARDMAEAAALLGLPARPLGQGHMKSDVLARYRALARANHPDRNNAPDALQTMQKLNAARDLLIPQSK